MNTQPPAESPHANRWFGPVLAGAGTVLVLGVLFLLWFQTPRPATATAPEVLRAGLELRNGLLYRKGAAEPFTGTMIERYPDGTLLSRSAVAAGRLHGLSEGWYPDGRLQVREQFVRGVSHGERVKWHPNGATQSVASIVEGQLHGRFLRWHENGALAEEMTLNRGRPEGWARSYYPGGWLKSRVRLVAGEVVEQQFWPEEARYSERPEFTAAAPAAPGSDR